MSKGRSLKKGERKTKLGPEKTGEHWRETKQVTVSPMRAMAASKVCLGQKRRVTVQRYSGEERE